MFTHLNWESDLSDRSAGTQISFGYFCDGTLGIEVQPNGLPAESMNTVFSNALNDSQLPVDVKMIKNPDGTQWYIKGNIDALMKLVEEERINLPISPWVVPDIYEQLGEARAFYAERTRQHEQQEKS
jgi:hypothetical protein